MGSIEEAPGTYYLGNYILCHIFLNEKTNSTERAWMTIVKKLINHSGSLKIQRNSTGNKWSCLRIGGVHEYLLQFVNIPTECVLNTLQFVHVETRQTSEKRDAVVQTTTHQDICHQDSSLIRQIQSGPPEIMHLNEASLTNIVDMISKGKISIKRDNDALYNIKMEFDVGVTSSNLTQRCGV